MYLLADYQRFVSYLYEYQNNIKSQNCGFCRVELRDHNCRLEIHMKLPVYPFLPTLKVYVFVPSNDKLYGIFLGNASYHHGNVTGTFSFTENNIQNSSYHFSQLGGIFIQSDTGFCFASDWKDLDINPQKFYLHTPTEINNTHSEKATLDTYLPISNAETTLDKPKIESDQPIIETTSSIPNETENLSCTTCSDIEKPEMPTHSEEELKPQTTEISIELETSKTDQKEEEINSLLHTEKQNFIISKSEPALLAASTDSAETTRKNTINNLWEQIMESYPSCHPFFDDEIHNCVQLSPKDIAMLHSTGYSIGRNAFFCHNCQSFQHFIIGKSTRANQTNYILAVPGIHNPKEQYMASMFGFPYFKCGQKSHVRNNCWGYWYRILPEHWNTCKS